MINPVQYYLDLPDGGQRCITVDPVLITEPGGQISTNGVFELTADDDDLGKLVFNENMDQYTYSGSGLASDDIIEIAKFIREYDEADIPEGQPDELDSFFFKETIDGIEHDYRITNNNGKFELEKDGILLAELDSFEHWKQISGDPLPVEVLGAIVNQIEDHYE